VADRGPHAPPPLNNLTIASVEPCDPDTTLLNQGTWIRPGRICRDVIVRERGPKTSILGRFEITPRGTSFLSAIATTHIARWHSAPKSCRQPKRQQEQCALASLGLRHLFGPKDPWRDPNLAVVCTPGPNTAASTANSSCPQACAVWDSNIYRNTQTP